MALEASNVPKGNGLKNAVDIVIAPKEALEAIRVAPTWGWAFLIAAVLLVGGFFLQKPAATHAQIGSITNMMAHNSLYSSLTDAQKQKAIDGAKNPPAYQTALGIGGLIVIALLAALLNSAILLLANAVGQGSAKFSSLWAGSVNILIPSFGFGSLILGIICMIRGPEAFDTQMELMRAVPGLGMVAPGVTGVLGGFLAAITIFVVWGCYLNVMMMRTTAGVKSAVAWIVPVLILLLGALLGGAGAAFAG
jgi:Yip1 domain